MNSLIFIKKIKGPVKDNYSPNFLISQEILGEDLDKSFLEKKFKTATENLFSLKFEQEIFSHVVWSSEYENGITTINAEVLGISDQRFEGIVNLEEVEKLN